MSVQLNLLKPNQVVGWSTTNPPSSVPALALGMATPGVLAVAPNQALLNPTFKVDGSVTNGVTGLQVVAGISGGGVSIQAIGGTGNEHMKILPAGTGSVMIPVAPPVTANYGLYSLGTGPFDGTSPGKFVGNASGTHFAINSASTFTGNFVDFQKNGTSLITCGPISSAGPGGFINIGATTFPAGTNNAYWGLGISINAGYTGNSFNAAANIYNLSAGTGTTYISLAGNFGLVSLAKAVGTGWNGGVVAQAQNSSTLNVGGHFVGANSNVTGSSVGVVGQAWNGVTASVGGYFMLGNPDIVPANLVSAVLIADDCNVASPCFLAKHNGTTFLTVLGAPTGASTTSNFLNITGTLPGTGVTAQVIGANFSFTGSAGTNQGIVGLQVSVPTGYTGSGGSVSLWVNNNSASTGSIINGLVSNYAVFGQSTGASVGNTNNQVGAIFAGQRSSILNVGCFGLASSDSGTVAVSVGLIGQAYNHTGSGQTIGVFAFAGRGANDGFNVLLTNLTVSAALYCDTLAASNAPVAIFNAKGALASQIDTNGNFIQGTGNALVTTAVNGFLYVNNCAGTPTGVPASLPTGSTPMMYDTSAHKLWLYDGGWKGVAVA